MTDENNDAIDELEDAAPRKLSEEEIDEARQSIQALQDEMTKILTTQLDHFTTIVLGDSSMQALMLSAAFTEDLDHTARRDKIREMLALQLIMTVEPGKPISIDNQEGYVHISRRAPFALKKPRKPYLH